MKTNTIKSKYVKPSITAVEWDFSESVCYMASPGIIIKDNTDRSKIDHFYAGREGALDDKWIEWPNANR